MESEKQVFATKKPLLFLLLSPPTKPFKAFECRDLQVLVAMVVAAHAAAPAPRPTMSDWKKVQEEKKIAAGGAAAKVRCT
eukprot:801293-Amphidinium_carterae.2